MKSKVYTLYQLPANSKKLFRSYNSKSPIDIFDYVGVYQGEMDSEMNDISICDELFEVFNIRHPNGFAGHSMSTSDVICIDTFEGDSCVGRSFYYCDSFGWKDITDEIETEKKYDNIHCIVL